MTARLSRLARSATAALIVTLFAFNARADCLPSDAGGYGVGFRITNRPEGVIYSWHCPTTDGGWVGQWLAIHADWSSVDPAVQAAFPKWPPDRAKRLQELSRLRGLDGYAVDSGRFLALEAKRVLEDSRPGHKP